MNLNNLYWREPLMLLLVLLPLLLMGINHIWRRRQLLSFAEPGLIPWIILSTAKGPKRLSLYSLITGWVFLCIALAGPRSIQYLPPAAETRPSALIVIVDLSASMNARDASPDRRTVAQRLLKRWFSHKPSSLAVGVVLFAGHAFELFPPTTDKAVISHFINSLSEIRLPTAGNDLSAAIKLATTKFDPGHPQRRLLVLTDGDIEQAEQRKVSQLLSAELDIATYFIGIGGSKPVTVPDSTGGLVKQKNRPVLSKMEAQWTKTLSGNPDVHFKLSQQAGQQELAALLQFPPLRLDHKAQQQVIWHEWFQVPLLLSVFLLWLSTTRPNQKFNLHLKSTLLPQFFLIALLIGLCLQQSVVYADDRDILKQAQQALTDNSFRQARQLFSQLNSIQAYFGEGASCYRLKDYGCAQQAFASAAWAADDNFLRGKAVFNLANSYFFSGDYDQAAVLYRDAEILGVDADIISTNLEFAVSMQAAVQRHLDYIQHSFEKAQWRAAATGKPVPSLANFLNDNAEFLSKKLNQDAQYYQAGTPLQTVQQAVERQLGLEHKTARQPGNRWVETDRVLSQSTAKMTNRLFAMQLGIHTTSLQPRIVDGKRQW